MNKYQDTHMSIQSKPCMHSADLFYCCSFDFWRAAGVAGHIQAEVVHHTASSLVWHERGVRML